MGKEREMTIFCCCSSETRHRVELVISILLGIWNNGTTLLNAINLYKHDYETFSYLTIFFLFFPGIVTALCFVILHLIGHKKIGKIPPLKVFGFFLFLFFFYPVVPISLCTYSLITGRRYHLATLARMFEGFLDDGPQFILKLIIVVLRGIRLENHVFDTTIFYMSLVSSFLSLVIFGVKFNERDTFFGTKLVLCVPMFGAFALARAFTMAVFLKETLGNSNEYLGGALILLLFFCINIASFKYCRQDLTRSIFFGLCSFLIPVGYGNDPSYYQCPKQNLSEKAQKRSTCENQRKASEVDSTKDGQNYSDGSLKETGDEGNNLVNETNDADLNIEENERISIEIEPKNLTVTNEDALDKREEKRVRNLKEKFTSKINQTRIEVKDKLEMTRTGVNVRLDQAKETIDKEVRSKVDQAIQRDFTFLKRVKSVVEPLPPIGVEQNHVQFNQMSSGSFLLQYTFSNAILLSSSTIYLVVTRELSVTSDNALILPLVLSLIPGCFFALSRAVLLPDLKPGRMGEKMWAPLKYTMAIIFGIIAFASVIPGVFWSAFYKVVETIQSED